MKERIINVILQNTHDAFGFHQDFKPHQNEERFGSLIILIAWMSSFGSVGWKQEENNKVIKKYINYQTNNSC